MRSSTRCSTDATIGHQVDRASGTARVRLWTAVGAWPWGWREWTSWRIGVSPTVPTVLDVQAGAGDFRLDLSSIVVTSAFLGIGAATLSVVLPRPTGEVPIRVEGGAARFTFHVPPGVEARVAVTGLATSAGPRETPGYTSATDRVSVTVTGGAASVEVVPGLPQWSGAPVHPPA